MPRTVKQPAVRRAEIVAAARALFSARGYEAATMQDVMDALGVAKGTIYHYFKSKEELFEAVVLDLVEETTAAMRAGLATSTGDALMRLRALMRSGSVAAEQAHILETLHSPANAGLHARLLGAAIQAQAPLYADLIHQGVEEGLFRTQAPLETAEFLLAAGQLLTDTGIYPWPPQDLARRVRALPALFETLLGARPGSFSFIDELFDSTPEEP